MAEQRSRHYPRDRQPPPEFKGGWLDTLDRRHKLTQDLQERFRDLCSDLGGVEELSYQQRSLVERALWLEYWISRQEQKLILGKDELDIGQWVYSVNALQGLYTRLGLVRKPKQPKSLQAYLSHVSNEKQEDLATNGRHK